MKTMLHVLTAAVLLVSFTSASAHSMDNDSMMMKMMKPTHEFGYISPGFSWINFGDFNNSLISLRLSPFPEQAWTLTLGKYKDWNRFIMESHITIRMWGDNIDSTRRSFLGAGDIIMNAGFNVLPPAMPLDLYPYLGLGAGLNCLTIRSDTKTLSDLLASTEPNSMLWQATPLLDLGIGSNFLLGSKDGSMGFAVGLRIGYLVDLYMNKKWNSDMTTVSGLPSITQNGAYLRLTLGGWGKHHHHHDMMEEHEK
jgi:hypothetical protein